jgi:hypothetical protein
MKAKLEVEADSVEEAQKGMKQNMTFVPVQKPST